MPLAHAKWFIDSSQHHQTDWSFFFDASTLALLAAALVVAGLWYVVGPRLRRGSLPVLAPVGRLAPLMPRLLAGGLGLALVTLAVGGRLLGPGTAAESVPGGLGLTLVQGVVGAWLVLGRRLKAAAGLLGLLCLASAVLGGPMIVLESGQVVGVALYLGLTSVPAGSDKRVRVTGTSSGARALGIALGVTLVIVAFTEKLGSPDVFAALLDGSPLLDALGAVSLSETTFIRLVGTAEVLLGLLLVTRAAPELVALTAAVPFLATLPVFGVTELVGHLSVYVALLALAVHAVAPAAAPAVAGRRLELPQVRIPLVGLASRRLIQRFISVAVLLVVAATTLMAPPTLVATREERTDEPQRGVHEPPPRSGQGRAGPAGAPRSYRIVSARTANTRT